RGHVAYLHRHVALPRRVYHQLHLAASLGDPGRRPGAADHVRGTGDVGVLAAVERGDDVEGDRGGQQRDSDRRGDPGTAPDARRDQDDGGDQEQDADQGAAVGYRPTTGTRHVEPPRGLPLG